MAKKLTVLCIDDQADFLATLEFWLRARNYEVINATNAIYGIDILKKGVADMVLVDYKMPGIDGIQAVKEIREIDPTIPLIIMTAHADDKMVRDLRMLNVNGFLSKLSNFDIDLENLLKEIDRGTG